MEDSSTTRGVEDKRLLLQPGFQNSRRTVNIYRDGGPTGRGPGPQEIQCRDTLDDRHLIL